MRKNAIVVGMPRSGTSMTAAIFARKGYFVAEDENKELRQGDEYNPSGYWEAEPLIKANAEVFNAVQFQHDNTWMYKAITKTQALDILQLAKNSERAELVQQYESHQPWIWKDPRLCYTVGYWWLYMNPETTGVLLLKRDPKEIFQSFLRVKWRTASKQDKTDTFERVDHHIQAAEYALEERGIPHIVVNYSDFANKPEATAQRISDFFGFELTPEELGFSRKLNNSRWRGKISTLVDNIADRIPDGLRKKLKACVPRSLIKMIFPHR